MVQRCLIFKVLSLLRAFLFYHISGRLSRTFFIFFKIFFDSERFLFILIARRFRDSFAILSHPSRFVKYFFRFFASFFTWRRFRILRVSSSIPSFGRLPIPLGAPLFRDSSAILSHLFPLCQALFLLFSSFGILLIFHLLNCHLLHKRFSHLSS